MKKMVMGFDFGTTNSTIGVATDEDIKLMNLGDKKIETRTALYYDSNKDEFISGDNAITEFRKQPKGRLFLSPKSSLNNKKEVETLLTSNRKIKLTNVIEIIIKQFKSKIEDILKQEVDSVVVGRPVKFHDTDIELDKVAQQRLELSLKNSGFKNIEFEYEPNAALKSYLHNNIDDGNILVVDIGGGTSDFSIVNVSNKKNRIISNNGIYIGGNRLDYVFSNDYFSTFLGKGTTYRSYNKNLEVPSIFYSIISDWKNVHNISLYKNLNSIKGYYTFSNDGEKYGRLLEISKNLNKGYAYLDMIEGLKKDLSYKEKISGKTDYFDNNFSYYIDRGNLNDIIAHEITKILDCVKNTIVSAGIRGDQINRIFLTGGTSLIPIVQKEILKILSNDCEIIKGDAFNSVGYGLTSIAQENFLK